jgi:hypothetical protein
MQHHSTSSSSVQIPTHTGSHACTLPSDPSASREHRAKWTGDLPKRGWISEQGAFPGAPNMVTDRACFNEKGHLSADTEDDGRRDATTWRRERKKRRRKAEIYVRFSFVPVNSIG